MKRRKFILAAAAAVAVLSVPVVYYSRKNKHHSYPPLLMPKVLGEFCDENVIREIGKNYRAKVHVEDDRNLLKTLLLTNGQQKISEKNKRELTNFLDKRIVEEFRRSQTVIERGWIISTTEARQCALFSLTNPI